MRDQRLDGEIGNRHRRLVCLSNRAARRSVDGGSCEHGGLADRAKRDVEFVLPRPMASTEWIGVCFHVQMIASGSTGVALLNGRNQLAVNADQLSRLLVAGKAGRCAERALAERSPEPGPIQHHFDTPGKHGGESGASPTGRTNAIWPAS